MREKDKGFFCGIEKYYKQKAFLLGANINVNKDFNNGEMYLCLYLGVVGVFIGYKF